MNALNHATELVAAASRLEDALIRRADDAAIFELLASVTAEVSQLTLAIARERPGVR